MKHEREGGGTYGHNGSKKKREPGKGVVIRVNSKRGSEGRVTRKNFLSTIFNALLETLQCFKCCLRLDFSLSDSVVFPSLREI